MCLLTPENLINKASHSSVVGGHRMPTSGDTFSFRAESGVSRQ